MISSKLQSALIQLGLSWQNVLDLVERAIQEDLQGGVDVTSVATVPTDHHATAEFRSRKNGIVSGLHVAAVVLETQGITDYQFMVSEGAQISRGDLLLIARGTTRSLLLAERTSLNFLSHLSGISTVTAQWVEAIRGTHAVIRDTRKTTPLLRELEKFAVRMGGGVNHRSSLSDAALIKDNHIIAAGGVVPAFTAVRAKYPDLPLEVEVDNLDQLREVVGAGADLVLLDNMTPEQCHEAVEIAAGRCSLEASGGLTLEKARAYAEIGVDYLAVGALTHSSPILDIGLDLRMES
jgi:nicotinate-nucleotide pyrophosphorylase (carboxylating)